jgi:mannose-6-phosphate isomerase-like protein (cupin superfamily)
MRAAWLILLLPAVARAQPDQARADAATQLLAKAQPGLHRCVEKVGADDYRRAAGDFTLTVTFGAPNRVKTVASGVDPALIDCAAQVFKPLSAPLPFAVGDSVELPLRFEATPNLTVRLDDAAIETRGRISEQHLLTRRSAATEQGNLVRLLVAAGGKLALDTEGGGALYVVVGEGTLGPVALTPGAAVALQGGTQPALVAKTALELVVVRRPFGPKRCNSSTCAPILGKAHPPSAVAEVLLTTPQARGISVTRLTLAPAGTVAEHAHGAEAELLFVRRGGGTLRVDGEAVPVTAGMAVHVPASAKHSFTVTSAEPFEAIQFYAPSGPERRFLPGATP